MAAASMAVTALPAAANGLNDALGGGSGSVIGGALASHRRDRTGALGGGGVGTAAGNATGGPAGGLLGGGAGAAFGGGVSRSASHASCRRPLRHRRHDD